MSETTSSQGGARVRFPPPLVFLAGILLGVACQLWVVPARVPAGATLRIAAGVGVLAIGIALIASARVWFMRTGQNPIPWKPTPSLILKGPYRFTRNPMYLGMTLFEAGLGVALDNLWISLFALPALVSVHYIAVLPEERHLSEKFGDSYASYLARVRRYL